MRVAYLACATTLPGSPTRREDAFEHDLQIAALRPAFAAREIELVERDWAAPLAAFEGCDGALIGTTWDYQDHHQSFLARLEALAMPVFNPPTTVRWNADKRYLRELAGQGAPIIPTIWEDDATRDEIETALDRFGCERVVVKRQVGAGALGQLDFARDRLPDTDWRLGRPAMIQPFLPAIETEGELSFVFIDGALSHAVRKRPAAGDYRIQSLFGGREEPVVPDPADLCAARDVCVLLPGPTPLYARIDMVRDDEGRLLLMEAELVEPYLYPEQGPQLGKRLAAALARRLADIEG